MIRAAQARARRLVAAGLAAALFVAASVVAAAAELLRDEASGLEYVEVITGGAAPTDALPLVVAMHGLGDNPESFRMLLDDLPVRARLVVPRAPMPYRADGWSWFAFRTDDDQGGAELGAGVRAAGDRVAALVTSLAARHGAPPRAVVCGFSQGGMLSFELAAAHPEVVEAAIPVSGYLPASLWPTERPRARPLPQVLALHGEKDDLIPADSARWSVEALRSNGFDTSIRTWPGVGHALSREMRAVLLGAVERAVENLAAGMAAANPVDPASRTRDGVAREAAEDAVPAVPDAAAQPAAPHP